MRNSVCVCVVVWVSIGVIAGGNGLLSSTAAEETDLIFFGLARPLIQHTELVVGNDLLRHEVKQISVDCIVAAERVRHNEDD